MEIRDLIANVWLHTNVNKHTANVLDVSIIPQGTNVIFPGTKREEALIDEILLILLSDGV